MQLTVKEICHVHRDQGGKALGAGQRRCMVPGDRLNHGIGQAPKPQQVGAYLGVRGSENPLLTFHQRTVLGDCQPDGYVVFFTARRCQHQLPDVV